MSLEKLFGNPIAAKLCCPKCSAEDWDVRNTQYGVWRICRKCGNEWSGGTMGANQPDFSLEENAGLVPPAGVPAPDDDLPTNNTLIAPYRTRGHDSDE